jgi:hypothetical protein
MIWFYFLFYPVAGICIYLFVEDEIVRRICLAVLAVVAAGMMFI